MLNIAKTIYAAWNPGSKYDLSEAEIIPLGETASEKKKLLKITQKYTQLIENDNIPLPGFTLYKTDRKNWGSLDQTWLVIDPRGFLVRISSENLEKILHVTGITEGLIQQKCVWARENAETKMTLVPVSSETFLEAVQNTELLENKVDIKEVQIGDTVLLQNTLTGIYMGVASLYGPLNDYSRQNEFKPQVLLRRQILEVQPGKYYYQVDLKILKVIKKASIVLTREEAIAHMCTNIQSSNFSNIPQTNIQHSGSRGEIRLVSISAIPKVSMSFEEITRIEAINLFNIGLTSSDFGMLILENVIGARFLVDYPYIFSANNNFAVNNFDVAKLAPINLDPIEKLILTDRRRSIWSASPYSTQPHNNSLDKFTKFYKIVKHVKDKTYV